MAETSHSKRQREDDDHHQYEEVEDMKRHKSYNQILSFLEEEEEEEPNQELLDMFQTLQQELSSDSSAADPLQISASSAEADGESGVSAAPEASSPSSKGGDHDEEDDRVRMMRHLLEASDDELGLPTRSESGDEEINSEEDPLFLGNGLWEFEDDAANYYTLLQSELFM